MFRLFLPDMPIGFGNGAVLGRFSKNCTKFTVASAKGVQVSSAPPTTRFQVRSYDIGTKLSSAGNLDPTNNLFVLKATQKQAVSFLGTAADGPFLIDSAVDDDGNIWWLEEVPIQNSGVVVWHQPTALLSPLTWVSGQRKFKVTYTIDTGAGTGPWRIDAISGAVSPGFAVPLPPYLTINPQTGSLGGVINIDFIWDMTGYTSVDTSLFFGWSTDTGGGLGRSGFPGNSSFTDDTGGAGAFATFDTSGGTPNYGVGTWSILQNLNPQIGLTWNLKKNGAIQASSSIPNIAGSIFEYSRGHGIPRIMDAARSYVSAVSFDDTFRVIDLSKNLAAVYIDSALADASSGNAQFPTASSFALNMAYTVFISHNPVLKVLRETEDKNGNPVFDAITVTAPGDFSLEGTLPALDLKQFLIITDFNFDCRKAKIVGLAVNVLPLGISGVTNVSPGTADKSAWNTQPDDAFIPLAFGSTTLNPNSPTQGPI